MALFPSCSCNDRLRDTFTNPRGNDSTTTSWQKKKNCCRDWIYSPWFNHQKTYLHSVKTSPTLYVSKVLVRHDRTPNMTDTITVRATMTETTITNNKQKTANDAQKLPGNNTPPPPPLPPPHPCPGNRAVLGSFRNQTPEKRGRVRRLTSTRAVANHYTNVKDLSVWLSWESVSCSLKWRSGSGETLLKALKVQS